MATSAISSFTSTYQPANSQSDFRQEFGQLASSINSGDLSGAQEAYASLSDLQSNGQGPALNPNGPFAQALTQIGQSLQNGDIGGAQSALASLKPQGHGGGHHHHGGGASSGSASAPPSNAAISSSGNTVDVTA